MCVCQNNKKYLNSILDDLEIEPYQKKIIAKRYLKQVSFYASKAKSSEIFYLFLRDRNFPLNLCPNALFQSTGLSGDCDFIISN